MALSALLWITSSTASGGQFSHTVEVGYDTEERELLRAGAGWFGSTFSASGLVILDESGDFQLPVAHLGLHLTSGWDIYLGKTASPLGLAPATAAAGLTMPSVIPPFSAPTRAWQAGLLDPEWSVSTSYQVDWRNTFSYTYHQQPVTELRTEFITLFSREPPSDVVARIMDALGLGEDEFTEEQIRQEFLRDYRITGHALRYEYVGSPWLLAVDYFHADGTENPVNVVAVSGTHFWEKAQVAFELTSTTFDGAFGTLSTRFDALPVILYGVYSEGLDVVQGRTLELGIQKSFCPNFHTKLHYQGFGGRDFKAIGLTDSLIAAVSVSF